MIKPVLLSLAFLLFASAVCAEEGSEHAEKAPPPKPLGAPVSEVLKLPIVIQWKQSEKDHKSGYLTAWGENISTVNGQKCWGIGLGEAHDNIMHTWRHFCVPFAGGDIWVEKISTHPEDDTVYLTYDKWVSECKPTAEYQGSC